METQTSQKKNQRRREVAKRNKALLNTSTTAATSPSSCSSPSFILPPCPAAADHTAAVRTHDDILVLRHTMISSSSHTLSPALSPRVSDETTFSPSTDPTTPSTSASCDSASELEEQDEECATSPEEHAEQVSLSTSTVQDLPTAEEDLHPLPDATGPELTKDSAEQNDGTEGHQNSLLIEDEDITKPGFHILSLSEDNNAEPIPLCTTDTTYDTPPPNADEFSDENVWATSDDMNLGLHSQNGNKDSAMDKSEQGSCTSQQQQQEMTTQQKHEPVEPETLLSVKEVECLGKPTSTESPEAKASSNSSSWDAASEHVATVALQCLGKDKDMELSYVAILSAMTILQSRQDEDLDEDYDKFNRELQKQRVEVALLYSQILRVMCRVNVVESLSKETVRQGIMSPEALYSQFYGSIRQAGYDLQSEAHLSMAQYWINRKSIDEAQDCISNIDTALWTGAVYRAAITCLLFSRPRQLQEAEALLQKYIKVSDSKNADGATLRVKTWYRLQLDASKWEDIKAQYEKRRARLLDTPANIERISTANDVESKLTSQALQQHQLQEQQQQWPSQRQYKHERSVSAASSGTASSHRRSPSGQHSSSPIGHQRSLSGHQRAPLAMPSWPSGASATLNANVASPPPAPAPTKGAFSFLSTLGFSLKGVDAEHPSNTSSSPLPSRIHVNRHLTVLDNNMLEECILHKEFEYGWKYVYEKMGSTLEDGDTARIAMRLCRRAFLGHSGLAPNQPGSPNVIARDMYFEDGIEDDSTLKAKEGSHHPEIWEARAWVIYNKAMMNSHTFMSSTTASSNHTHLASTDSTHGTGVLPNPGTYTSVGHGASPVSMFLHDILTIAIHSPEMSSRYLKAFKIYSAMRGDPQYQHQLRDPFVISCMIKAVYDAVLAVTNGSEQDRPQQRTETLKHQRRASSLSLNRTQPMTLGPLVDLAFEIYADMRNVGPIRHLPSLITLAPISPTANVSQTVGTLAQLTAAGSTSTSSTGTVEPSEVGTASTVSISPRSSFSVLSMTVFQDLNPSVKPNSHARHLSPDIYLALLHLCIQVPVYRISSQVVRTIVDDMMTSSGGNVVEVDYHLAAALQCYHDSWMCSIDPIAPKEDCGSSHGKAGTSCIYHEWMYQTDEYVEKHIRTKNRLSTVSGTSSGSDDVGEADTAVDELRMESEGSGHDCNYNEQLYWDLWSSEDEVLKSIRFSRTKAIMLWKHVAQALL
ncbi:hypothetical protein BGX28_008233 [Mortierella sp. GBA30]|nr:hypothetical protein BGX28_008233 [Mortierella sp. GBA30]